MGELKGTTILCWTKLDNPGLLQMQGRKGENSIFFRILDRFKIIYENRAPSTQKQQQTNKQKTI